LRFVDPDNSDNLEGWRGRGAGGSVKKFGTCKGNIGHGEKEGFNSRREDDVLREERSHEKAEGFEFWWLLQSRSPKRTERPRSAYSV